jgi:hypothetical protein
VRVGGCRNDTLKIMPARWRTRVAAGHELGPTSGTRQGLLLVVVALTASVQDRDGAKPVLLDTYLRTRVRFVFADGGFAGRLLDWAQQLLATTLHIVRKPAGQQGFAVIPRQWAVERTLCAARRSVVSPVQLSRRSR